jgi:hypothetical protein
MVEMNLEGQTRTSQEQTAFESLFAALRRQDSDTKVSELIEGLRARGISNDDVVARVAKSVGANAGVRTQKLARNRAQLMATGTMQRYKPSRARRFRRWLQNIKESLGGGTSPRQRR